MYRNPESIKHQLETPFQSSQVISLSNFTVTIRCSITLFTTQNIVSQNHCSKGVTLPMGNKEKTHHISPNPSQAYQTLQLAHAVRSQPSFFCAAYHVCTASGTAVVSSAVYRVSVAVMVL